MKKLMKLSLILLIVMYSFTGIAYAATSCNVTINASKTEVSKGEEFTVEVNLTDMQSDLGIISLGATLEYDQESLELIEMQGKNGWESPTGMNYNKTNGKIVITRNEPGKNNETIFTIKFKVKDNSKQEPVITVKDITVGDGDKPVTVVQASKKMALKAETPNQIPSVPTPDNSSSTNPSGGSSSNKQEEKPSKLPHAGNSNTMIMGAIGLAMLSTVVFFMKMKKAK